MSDSAAAIGTRGTRRLVAAPDSLLAAVFLAFLATAGLFYVNIMPAIVSGLIDSLHFSARDAGRVGSANMFGAALGALASVWLAQRFPWRRLATGALCGLIIVDLLSLLLSHPAPLIAARLLHGMIGGLLVGTAFLVISRTRVPERTFGVLVFVQYGLGGLGLALLPHLVAVAGSQVLFLVLVAFSLVTLGMLPFLGPYTAAPPVAVAARPQAAGGTPPMLVVALLAVLLFQAGNMALMAYIIELGRAFGLSTGGISATLGVANWIGVLGTVLVVVMGLRAGRVRPLAVALVAAVAGTAAFHWSGVVALFVAANIVTTVAWAFCVPYLLGMCAAFDRTGRAATLASFFSKIGLASGPFVASQLVGRGDWGLIINCSTGALAASAVLALLAAGFLDRSRGT